MPAIRQRMTCQEMSPLTGEAPVENLLTNPIFIIFAWLTITSVVGTVAHYWHKVQRDALDAALKQEMLQRGMSADDIVKVIQGVKTKSSRKAAVEQGATQAAMESRA
jgi:hypothetical protein